MITPHSISRLVIIAAAAVALATAALMGIALLPAARAQTPEACDWNNDGKVDSSDIASIRANIGMTVVPAGGKGDPNADGVITINDVRACVLRCTKPACAP